VFKDTTTIASGRQLKIMSGQTGKQFVNTDMTFIAREIAKNNESNL